MPVMAYFQFPQYSFQIPIFFFFIERFLDFVAQPVLPVQPVLDVPADIGRT